MELPAGLVLPDFSVRSPPPRRTRARPTASASRDRRRIQPHPARARTRPAHSARLLLGSASPAHKYVRTAYVTEESGKRLTLSNQTKPELTEARSVDLCHDFHFPSRLIDSFAQPSLFFLDNYRKFFYLDSFIPADCYRARERIMLEVYNVVRHPRAGGPIYCIHRFICGEHFSLARD